MKATLNAFLPNHNLEMYKYYSESNQPRGMVNCLVFSSEESLSNWIQLGTAEIEINHLDHHELNAAQVESLKAQKKSIQAEAQSQITLIEEKIQSLLCLEAPNGSD